MLNSSSGNMGVVGWSYWLRKNLLLKSSVFLRLKYCHVGKFLKFLFSLCRHRVFISKHPAFSYSLITHCSFNSNKNKHDYYRGEDCKKIVCKYVIKHVTKIINYEKIEMLQLTKEGKKSYKQKFCSIHAKKLVMMIKNVFILEITVITLGNIGILCT